MRGIVCRLAVVATLMILPVYGQDPEITKEILPEIKRQGETGALNCTVTRQQNYKVYWSHGISQMTITADDKVEIDPRLNEIVNGLHKYAVTLTIEGELRTYTLFIRRLIPNDAGIYTCTINVKGASAQENPSKTGKMVVISPPVIVQGRTSHTITIQEGEPADLVCDAYGFPKPNITWVRSNGAALPSPINVVRYKGTSVHIQAAHRRDRGVYRCIADNTVRPPARQDITLYVNFKPYARPVQTTYGQAGGRNFDVVLECRIQGQPEPDLQWYKVGDGGNWKAINEDDKHKIHVLLSHGNMLEISEFWFQLHIINVQAGDMGDYKCEGKNRLGSTAATVRLFQTSECQGANCPWVNVVGGKSSKISPHATLVYLLVLVFTLGSL